MWCTDWKLKTHRCHSVPLRREVKVHFLDAEAPQSTELQVPDVRPSSAVPSGNTESATTVAAITAAAIAATAPLIKVTSILMFWLHCFASLLSWKQVITDLNCRIIAKAVWCIITCYTGCRPCLVAHCQSPCSWLMCCIWMTGSEWHGGASGSGGLWAAAAPGEWLSNGKGTREQGRECCG